MYIVFVHVKGLQSYKAQSPHQRELLSPTETLLLNCLKRLAWSPAFSSVTWWCHQVTHLHNTASLARPQTKLVQSGAGAESEEFGSVDQSQQSQDQSEQTGLFRMGGAGAQTERFSTEGEKRCCSTAGMRKVKRFLNIKACKHVLVET